VRENPSERIGSIGKLIIDFNDYIDFYNHQRLHETPDYKKTNGYVPRNFEVVNLNDE